MQASGHQSVTVEDSTSVVHVSGALVEPPRPLLRSAVSIACGMAKATVPDNRIGWGTLDEDHNVTRDNIGTEFPHLFADFNARIRVPGGFYLYTGPEHRAWKTASRRANLFTFPGVAEEDDVQGPAALKLSTIRSPHQYSTTIYGLNDRYRNVFDDTAARRIKSDTLVELKSSVDRATALYHQHRASRLRHTISRAARSRPTIPRRMYSCP
jgi:hypothetical protein